MAIILPSVAAADDEAKIRAQIDVYVQSINTADVNLAARVWYTTGDVSLFHPNSSEYGWAAVRDNFYSATMGSPFLKRDLRVRDIRLDISGDTAVALFMWDFNATFRGDGGLVETHGRDTQVYRKRDGEWKIVHEHYSVNPPAK